MSWNYASHNKIVNRQTTDLNSVELISIYGKLSFHANIVFVMFLDESYIDLTPILMHVDLYGSITFHIDLSQKSLDFSYRKS